MIDYQKMQQKINEYYYGERTSLQQVQDKFGLKSRTAVYTFFKKYNIKLKSKETAMQDNSYQKDLKFFADNNICFDKETLKKELEITSILQLCKQYKVSKSMLSRYISMFGLENNYYKNLHLKGILDLEENLNLSPKELALKYNSNTTIIRKFRKTPFVVRIYSLSEIRQKIIEYKYDVNNQAIVKQIKEEDPNLFNSIIEHTKTHKLYGNKFTEKLYRILHKFPENKEIICKFCSAPLKFYTTLTGYGGEACICQKCLPKHCSFGVSKSSQKLFWELFEVLEDKEEIQFNELNQEQRIYLSKTDKENFSLLNSSYYRVDFTQRNKIIEYDGEYWHKNENFDREKDNFFISKGFQILRIKEKEYLKNKQQTIDKCITFLTQ